MQESDVNNVEDELVPGMSDLVSSFWNSAAHVAASLKSEDTTSLQQQLDCKNKELEAIKSELEATKQKCTKYNALVKTKMRKIEEQEKELKTLQSYSSAEAITIDVHQQDLMKSELESVISKLKEQIISMEEDKKSLADDLNNRLRTKGYLV